MRNKDPRYINSQGVAVITLENGTLSGTWVSDASSEGSYIEFITATNDDSTTATQVVSIDLLDGSDTLVSKLGNFVLTAEAGTKSDGSVAVDDIKGNIVGLDVDGAGNSILNVPAGYKIQATANAINAGDNVWISIGYGEYAAD